MAIRVVLADDARDLRHLIRTVLDRDGRFEVVGEAGDGEELVAIVRESCPDVAVVDLAMPLMDGLEAIPHVRRSCPTTKIAVLTAFEAETLEAPAMASGADVFLEKDNRLASELPNRLLNLVDNNR